MLHDYGNLSMAFSFFIGKTSKISIHTWQTRKKIQGKVLKVYHQKIMLRLATAKISCLYQNNKSSVVKAKFTRHNFSVVACYSLKSTRSLFLIVKSLVSHSKICSLPVPDVARCKKSMITHCRRCSFQKITSYSLRNLLITCCRNCSLQKITSYSLQNLLLTRCGSCLWQKITGYSLQKLQVAKIHLLLVANSLVVKK